MSRSEVDGPARPGTPQAHRGTRIAVVSRGDPLTSYLHAALAERYPVTATLDVELRGPRRIAVAGLSVRPTLDRWREDYIRSIHGYRARSRLATRLLDGVAGTFDVALQTHALFDCGPHPAMIYIDCTYRQAMAGWPAWTLSRERPRQAWLRRETAAYRRAVHLFAFNSSTQESLAADYGIDLARISVVGAGVNFDSLSIRPRTPGAAPTVLFVGKEFERKGGPLLLRAFARVRAGIPNARLQIVGCQLAGPVPAGVEVIGLLTDRARLADLYSTADVFCLPSRFDPGAIVVLEAMAHGLPCVVTRDASQLVHDLVDDRRGGWMVETGDEIGLADGITELLRRPDLAGAMGSVARDHVLADRRWSDVVGRMAPVLDAAASPTAP